MMIHDSISSLLCKPKIQGYEHNKLNEDLFRQNRDGKIDILFQEKHTVFHAPTDSSQVFHILFLKPYIAR